MVAILRPPPSFFDLTDTNFAGIVPGEVAIWNGLWWLPGAPAPALHAWTHQFGGIDQINIAGLPGVSAQLALHLGDFLNPHAVTWAQTGAIQNAPNTVNDTHIDWGVGANQVSADDIPDGAVNAIVTLVQEAAWDAHLIAVNNPHTVTLDQAYDAGATITVDAAGGDLIINLAAATDFKIQDAGADLFVIADNGNLTHTAPAALATVWSIGQVGAYTTDANMTIVQMGRTAVIPASATTRTYIGFDIGVVSPFSVTHPQSGSSVRNMYAMQFRPTLNTPWSGGGPFNMYGDIIYGTDLLATLTGDDAATAYLSGTKTCGGILGGSLIAFDVTGGATPTTYAYGVYGYGRSNATITAGGLIQNAWGVWAYGRANTNGTTIAYGIEAAADSADTLYAGFFHTNQANAIGATVLILQDSLTGACPVLRLDQDDISDGFIDFVGSARGIILNTVDSVDSCRVEMNGVVRRLALYADA